MVVTGYLPICKHIAWAVKSPQILFLFRIYAQHSMPAREMVTLQTFYPFKLIITTFDLFHHLVFRHFSLAQIGLR